MGAPIESVTLALNANRTIVDYLKSGNYAPRASVETLANAMDVGAPSNMERLFALYGDLATMRLNVSAHSIDDAAIRQTIKETYEQYGYIICPHTATGVRVRKDFVSESPTIVVSTAHPAKFEMVVEPLIGHTLEVPPALEELLKRDTRCTSIGTDYRELFQ
jgi:threonine synthase